MSGATFTAALAGAEQLQRALKLANPLTKARVVGAIKRNTQAITAGTRADAPRVTGELASTIRDEYSQDGLTGYVKVGFGKLPRKSKAQTVSGIRTAALRVRPIGKGAYAPVVEHGDPLRHHLPHPFLNPPYQAQKPAAIADISHALNDSIDEIASGAHP